ncbi:hypothetical protein EG329_001851 [Mollisiaceae sp. DMI_Dod_QoI]|nr:hypothetical protein EG329_001851 [Helotiales sp. DMI_Dod_QoI]
MNTPRWAPWGAGSSDLNRRDNNAAASPLTSWIQTEPKNYTYTVYHNTAAIAMIFLAANILLFTALITGLILGLCGLNMTLLELRVATGTPKEKKQALTVAHMKKHQTWMLCSLIIVSVAFGESFPFLVQSLNPGNQMWIAILVSTLCIAIIGEILPQYIIPRRAVAWGYYCWPVVWGCMFITGIVSFPLAWCLDRIAGQKDDLELFTNDELGGLIRYHEKSEKHGGALGQDASRIMIGALKLDSRKIGGEITVIPEPDNREQDLEKADLIVVQGMIVRWSVVKVIHIDERVDEDFIKKVRGWSYSRIPVIGNSGKDRRHLHSDVLEWTQGTQIYGFLHTKSLLGLDFKSPGLHKTPLLVKDMPLYPLPIVREDMSVYELLNMFQSGMSRMAIVISNDQLTCSKGAVWTVTDRTNEQTILKLEESEESHQWTMDYLAAARAASDNYDDKKYHSRGIRSPKPIGIVTFEDIIDTILQKTSRDEKDFYDRKTLTPPTKTKKTGDFPVDMARLVNAHTNSTCKTQEVSGAALGPYGQARNTLRRRNVTNDKTICAVNDIGKISSEHRSGPGAMDGANENSSEASSNGIKIRKTRGDCVESSYTQNGQGGFHAEESSHSNENLLTPEDIAELAAASSTEHPKYCHQSSATRSLPSRKCDSRSLSDELKQTFRHVSAAPKLPTLRRVTPFSRSTASSSGRESDKSKDAMELAMPKPLAAAAEGLGIDGRRIINSNVSEGSMEEFFDRFVNQHVPEKSGETLSLDSSDDEKGIKQDATRLYDAFPVPLTRSSPEVSHHTHHSLVPIKEELEKRYDGFPMELLDYANKENRILKYISSTMPRTKGAVNFDTFESTSDKEFHERESSFHDDRALLPSQRRAMEQNEESITGIRRTSLWF